VDDLAIYNAATATQSPIWRFQSMFNATKFVVAGVIVALFGGFLASGVLTQQAPSVPGAATGDAGTFNPTGSLAEPRAAHTATLLPDGRVLVVGGAVSLPPEPPYPATATAEIWDPGTDTFGPTGSLAEPRSYHTATLLPDGRVLVAGGWRDEEDTEDLASAEVWDPSTNTFSPAGSLARARTTDDGGIAVALPDGRVLVVMPAVDGDDEYSNSAEVWDPATSAFSPAGSLPMDDYNAATALADGRVLIFNDEDPTEDGYSGSAVVWDPVTDTVSPAGSSARCWMHSPTLLADGRVLIIGYSCPDGNGPFYSAEVWDPATSTFSPAGSPTIRVGHFPTTTALPDGRVLIVAGCGQSVCDSVEVWDPDTDTFGPTGWLAEPRLHHTTTALPDGRALVVGGFGEPVGQTCGWTDCVVRASAEVWEPSDR
jgi:hypothetical protein